MHLEKKLIIPELIPLKSLNSSLNIYTVIIFFIKNIYTVSIYKVFINKILYTFS